MQPPPPSKLKFNMGDLALLVGITLAFIYLVIKILEIPEKKR